MKVLRFQTSKGAVAFRQNQIKNDRSIVKTVFLSFFDANLKKSRLKTCGFLRFYHSFLFYPRFLAQRTLVRFSLVLLVREQTYSLYRC